MLFGFEGVLLFGNAVNLVGVAGLFASNYIISMGADLKWGFRLATIGGILVALGSAILGSYPVVLLNVLWALVGMIGIGRWTVAASPWVGRCAVSALMCIGLVFIASGDLTAAAYVTTAVYVLGFFLFSIGAIGRAAYLTWSCLGFVFLVPHLIEVASISVLINEAVGFAVSATGLVRIGLATGKRAATSVAV